MKVGRNDPCPCKSGKKYKKCCIDKELPFDFPFLQNKRYFSGYNSFELLQTIAGLALIPENHGKNIRFEILTLEVLQSYNYGNKHISPQNLKKYLDENFHRHHLEDPSINMFTDLVTFHGGDYLIFPGISENGSFILSNLLVALFQLPNSDIPDSFKSKIYQVTLLLLNLSNEIAKRIGYGRYLEGIESETEIYFPNNGKLDNLKECVIFTENDMNQLLVENSISKNALNLFLIDINAINFDEKPLLVRPILFLNGKYLVYSPTTLSYVLTNFIWSEAERMNIMKLVNNAYQNVLWNNIQFQLSKLKFLKIDYPFEKDLKAKIGLYRFDEDKIALIQMLYDNGSDYLNLNKSKHKRIEAIEEIIENVKIDVNFKEFQLFDVNLYSPIGRDIQISHKKDNPNINIGMSVYELDILFNSKKSNAIDLWNFANAKEKKEIISFSFLDTYKFYKDHKDSFYYSDEITNFVIIQPGYSFELIKVSIQKTDKHSVLKYIEGELLHTQVQKKDKYSPVYFNLENIVNKELDLLVEGFNQPIWVEPISNLKLVSVDLRHIYWEFCETIAYWLWQIQSEINIDLSEINNPITFQFDIFPQNEFLNFNRIYDRDENLKDKFIIDASKSVVVIKIPMQIMPYLYGSENEGERNLVYQLLLGINKLLFNNSMNEISDSKISQIIENKVPLGIKKKLLLFDTKDNLLFDNRNLPDFRYVQNYNSGVILDLLVPKLGDLCPEIGSVLTKEEKNNLTKNINLKVLLPLLRDKLRQYNSTHLLEILFGQNESLIRKREELRIFTPTRIACYVTIEQHEIDLKEDLGNVNRTSLAIRCLIEHLAAEPYYGNKIISITAIDELLAIMDQIVTWGSLSDQIHFDLLDIKIDILPSGRIGRDNSSEIFDPYYTSKTLEYIHDSIESYNQSFPQIENFENQKIPANLNNAFIEDFGISFSRVSDFLECLTIIGFNQNRPFASLPFADLNNEINYNLINGFNEKEFQSAISFLSLTNRGKVDTIDKSKGHEFIDVMPWRFNRMLSLLRKPLVIVEDNNSKIVYWGSRQNLISRLNLTDQILSDRLRVSEKGAVKKVLGKFAQKRGDELVKSTVASINPFGLIIDTDVYISPNHVLYNETDIGDIDVLIIDKFNQILFSLECKSISPSRNVKEMIEEVDKLFGSESDKGWIEKHLKREEWIKGNLNLIGQKYNVDLTEFTVKSFFITKEDMLTPYLKKQILPIPFITSYEMEKKGLNALF